MASSSSIKITTQLKQQTTPDISDKYGDLLLYPNLLQYKYYGKLQRFQGYIRTVRCYHDNSKVKEILQQNGNNNTILIIDGGGSPLRSLVGDQIALLAYTNNWNGIIVHGPIRDTKQINTIPIGIIALGTSPRKTEKLNSGNVDINVSFASVTFQPGSYLIACEDGVVIIPKNEIYNNNSKI